MGVPASCRNCFGRSLGIRDPVPAAAMIAMFMKRDGKERAALALGDRFGVGDSHRMRAAARLAHLPSRAAVGAVNVVVAVLGFFPETAEDHLAGSGLQHTGHSDVGVLADQPARVNNDYHRAVVEIS